VNTTAAAARCRASERTRCLPARERHHLEVGEAPAATLTGYRPIDRDWGLRPVGLEERVERRNTPVKFERVKHEWQTVGVEEGGSVHQLKAKVGPACVPGVPDLAQDLPGPHLIAAPHPQAARLQVSVGSEHSLGTFAMDWVPPSSSRDTERAMSQENVELVYKGNEAFNRRDIDAFLALVDPDVAFISRFIELEGGEPYRGRDGIRTWWQKVIGVWRDLSLEIEEVRDLGGVTATRVRLRGHGMESNAPWEQSQWHVMGWRRGKVTRWRSSTGEAEALDAAGLQG
jgi:ketosteroid isomerase-like protein